MIPIGKRVSAVVAERPTRKTYFSHSVRSISEEACASIPVDAKLSTRVFTRSELDPSYSPRMILCNEPVWPITPGRTIAVAPYPTPPSTALSPNRAFRIKRSDERRVGKACVSKCRSRGSPYHQKKKNQNE